MVWIGLMWLRIGTSGGGGSYEHGNEPPGSIKCWKFLSSCTIGWFSRRVQLHESVKTIYVYVVGYV
jgi:hypothetical protein